MDLKEEGGLGDGGGALPFPRFLAVNSILTRPELMPATLLRAPPPRIFRPSYGPVTWFMFVPLTQSASEIIIYFQNGRIVKTLRSIPIFENKMSSWLFWVRYKKVCVDEKRIQVFPNFPDYSLDSQKGHRYLHSSAVL